MNKVSLVFIFITTFYQTECFSDSCSIIANYSCDSSQVNDGTGYSKNADMVRDTTVFLESKKDKIIKIIKTSILKNNFLKKNLELLFPQKCNAYKQNCEELLSKQYLEFFIETQSTGKNKFLDKPNDIKNAFFNSTNLDSDLQKFVIKELFGNDTFKKNYQQANIVFDDIKQEWLGLIKNSSLDPSLKKKIATKCGAIKLEMMDPQGAAYVSSLFNPNAGYNLDTNKISIFPGTIVNSSSKFTLSQFFAHEMSHCIDPCSISQEKDGLYSKITEYTDPKSETIISNEYIFPDLYKCLRSEHSISARRIGPTGQDPKLPIVCNSNDQILEATSDYLGIEVSSRYLEKKFENLSKENWLRGVSNMFRPFCKLEKSNDIHPTPKKRIEKILMTNPIIREKLNCSIVKNVNFCKEPKLKEKNKELNESKHSETKTVQ